MSTLTDAICLGYAFTGDLWASFYWHEDGRVMTAFSLTPGADRHAVAIGRAATEAHARRAADAFLNYHRAHCGWEHPARHCSRLPEILAESEHRQRLCDREPAREGPVARDQALVALALLTPAADPL